MSAEEDDAPDAPSVWDLLIPIECLGEGEPVTGVVDVSLPILAEVLAVLDRHLEVVYAQAERSPDPDQFGDLDRLDWIAGLGFTACQTYITEMGSLCTLHGWKPPELRMLGPQHACGAWESTVISGPWRPTSRDLKGFAGPREPVRSPFPPPLRPLRRVTYEAVFVLRPSGR